MSYFSTTVTDAVDAPRAGFATTRVGRRAVVTVDGEIDVACADLVTDALLAAASDGAGEIWLDLSDTDFMDSAGLHAILLAYRELLGQQRRLALICGDGMVRRLIELARLDDLMPLHPPA